MFILDVETLSVESTAVILSASLISFDMFDTVPDEELSEQKMVEIYNHYRQKAITVKFDQEQQIKEFKRTIDMDTVKWWNRQSEMAKDVSFYRKPTDLKAMDGIDRLNAYIEQNGGAHQKVWIRGTLDQMVLDSLCRNLKIPPLFHYRYFLDVRTGVELIANESSDGYCRIKHFDYGNHVVKHIPANDCSLDIMMLLYHD